MSTLCKRIRRTLEETGPQGLREDVAAQEHLADCEGCFEMLEAAGRLNEALAGLEPLDAPDGVVDQLLIQVREDDASPLARQSDSQFSTWMTSAWLWLRQGLQIPRPNEVNWARASAVLVVMASGGMALWLGVRQRQDAFPVGDTKVQMLRFEVPETAPSSELWALGDEEELEALRSQQRGLQDSLEGNERQLRREGSSSGSLPTGEQEKILEARVVRESSAQKPELPVDRILVGGDESGQQVVLETGPAEHRLQKGLASSEREAGFGGKLDGERADKKAKSERDDAEQNMDLRARDLQDNLAYLGYLEGVEVTDTDAVSESPTHYDVDRFTKVQSESEVAKLNKVGTTADNLTRTSELDDGDARAARAFLEMRARVDGLDFQDATGYWSNQYVPGDPVFRLLQSRLLGRGRATLEGYSGTPVALHDAAHQVIQPFDPPNGAALAVYLQADRSSLDEPGRMLLQVGLQATERRSGRRPALNLAVVFDLRGEIDAATAGAFRALATALEDSRDVGDRFQLLVAGRPGELLVGADEFRHGPLTIALEQLFGVGGSTAQTLGLPEALALAVSEVHKADDPTSPLGSSSVMLVTAAPLGADLASLERLAHASAVDGVPLTVVGIGSRVERSELDRMALAGQGNRRLMSSPAEAASLVDRELSAVGRLVARALRLRIRLAPGVKLVQVLGSQRLDAARAQAVRDAELSLDLRMARNLGIEADRGEDEEGIQIVIPNFYAADAHVVLLDVVVPGPGAVADVTIRYKDLVHLRNGVARDHLTVVRGESTIEPLGLNVFKNLLALELFQTLETAGRQLESGDSAAATRTLQQAARLLRGLRHEVAGLALDRDLESDIAMLEEYIALLDAGAGVSLPERQHLVDSLRLAGRLKILPQPVVD